jgi:hypothetical protein
MIVIINLYIDAVTVLGVLFDGARASFLRAAAAHKRVSIRHQTRLFVLVWCDLRVNPYN